MKDSDVTMVMFILLLMGTLIGLGMFIGYHIDKTPKITFCESNNLEEFPLGVVGYETCYNNVTKQMVIFKEDNNEKRKC